MAKKGGRRTMKRYAAPRSVGIERKVHVWMTKPMPGPHSKETSITLRSIVRDHLGLGLTAKEADLIISKGNVLVDSVPKKEPKFPVGLMDVVQIPSSNRNMRVLIDKRGRLVLTGIEQSETMFKLCKVVNKKTVKGGKIQLIFHDGKSVIGDFSEIKPMDVLKVELPKLKVLERLPFQVGASALVTGGANVGMIGKISEIRTIYGSQPNIVTLSSNGTTFQASEKHVFVIGGERPIIKIPEDNQ